MSGQRTRLPAWRYVIIGVLVLTLGAANMVLAGDGKENDLKRSLVSIVDALTGTAAKVNAQGDLAVNVSNLPLDAAGNLKTTSTTNVTFPATQNVSGTVNVGNFPATQSVSVSALPATVELFANAAFIPVAANELHAAATLDVSHVEKIRVVVFNIGPSTANIAFSMVTSNNQLVALLDSFPVGPGQIEQRTYELPGRSLILFVDQRGLGATSVQFSVWGR